MNLLHHSLSKTRQSSSTLVPFPHHPGCSPRKPEAGERPTVAVEQDLPALLSRRHSSSISVKIPEISIVSMSVASQPCQSCQTLQKNVEMDDPPAVAPQRVLPTLLSNRRGAVGHSDVQKVARKRSEAGNSWRDDRVPAVFQKPNEDVGVAMTQDLEPPLVYVASTNSMKQIGCADVQLPTLPLLAGHNWERDLFQAALEGRRDLFQAALAAGVDDKTIVSWAQAAARLILISAWSSQAGVSEKIGKQGPFRVETGTSGRATIERIFFNSLPKDMIEIVSVEHVAHPDAMTSFLRLLVDKGSWDLGVMFSMDGTSFSDIAPLAGIAHRLASRCVDEDGHWRMFIVLVAHHEILPPFQVTYRLTPLGKGLTESAQQERFERVEGAAVECAAMLIL